MCPALWKCRAHQLIFLKEKKLLPKRPWMRQIWYIPQNFTSCQTHIASGTSGMLLFFVVGSLVAPIAEEVFFRGIVYGFLRRWGMVVALVGSTVAFVLAHAISSGIPLTQIVGGVVFAVAYEVTGNLVVPITIHVLGNAAILTLSLVPL